MAAFHMMLRSPDFPSLICSLQEFPANPQILNLPFLGVSLDYLERELQGTCMQPEPTISLFLKM